MMWHDYATMETNIGLTTYLHFHNSVVIVIWKNIKMGKCSESLRYSKRKFTRIHITLEKQRDD